MILSVFLAGITKKITDGPVTVCPVPAARRDPRRHLLEAHAVALVVEGLELHYSLGHSGIRAAYTGAVVRTSQLRVG